MLLRRLEAYGFKSFADKTEIEFGRGVTAIVGPNGSGKSNISDAIRWALGEQSIRNLRGSKLEDVIFSGSSGRRPMGVAEVSLTFDNSDGSLPLDFNEVTITRRVFRSGDSEYLINKTHCRLKDIHDLLANTGLGRDSMTIIGQNKIDEILNSKAEERRLLFEDAAGITKYKQRKKDALRKLEDTNQNLLRVGDITAEILSQLTPLSESAAKTEKYNILHSELVTCQVSILLGRLSKAEKMLESASLQKQSLNDTEIIKTTSLNLKETEKERLTTDLEQTNESIEEISKVISQASADLERLDGQIGILNERVSQNKQLQKRVLEDQSRIQKQSQELRIENNSLKDRINQKQLQEQQLSSSLEKKLTQLEKITQEINSLEEKKEISKEQVFDYLQVLINERNKVSSIEQDLAKIQQRRIKYEDNLSEANIQLSEIQQLKKTIQQEQQNVVTEMQQLNIRKAQTDMGKKELDHLLQQCGIQENNLERQLNELTSRRKILANMQAEYEGFGRGIKGVLKSNASWRSGICGAVGQIISVPDSYVTAIEIALGGALQHIVTEDDATAKQAINFLKTNKMGRATFLPLTTIRPQAPREIEVTSSRATGTIGFAADLVSYDQRYRTIVQYLLGRIIVVDNIDTALQVAKESSFNLKIVTLDGELLTPGGSMTGGSIHRRETSFLSRNNEIEKLKDLVYDTECKLDGARVDKEKCQRKLSEIEKQLLLIAKEIQTCDLRKAELSMRHERANADMKRISFSISSVKEEIENCQKESHYMDELLLKTKAHIKELEKDDVKHKQSVQEWEKKLKEMQVFRDQLNAAITDDKVTLSALRQEISSIENTLDQYKRENSEFEGKINNLVRERADLEGQIAVVEQQILEIKNKRTELSHLKMQQEKEYQQLYTRKAAILGSMKQLEQEVKELRRAVNDLQNRLHEVEILNTKYNYEVTHCINELQEQYSLTVAEANSLRRIETISQLTAMIGNLDSEIAELGPINPSAIEEYHRLQERYQFLQKQCEDLVSAKDYLSSIIRDIDSTMARQFSIAFGKINEYFRDIFIKLFGGGKAHLELADPSNLLESGIEIYVQPPGKKQQNLVLLSGGERALTVIALLFAFLTYRPAPFSVVDEIDAPLDEANLQRFSKFLREYSQNTQFIVVTHRKGTMEAADVMHGVTIEEAGISRLISVKFTEKAG